MCDFQLSTQSEFVLLKMFHVVYAALLFCSMYVLLLFQSFLIKSLTFVWYPVCAVRVCVSEYL